MNCSYKFRTTIELPDGSIVLMHGKAELEGISKEKKAIFLTDYGDIFIGWYSGREHLFSGDDTIVIRLEEGDERGMEYVRYIDLKGWGYLESN